MKKVLILSLALILLLGVAANGTFGLFSDAETSTGNTFTAWVEEVVCAKFNVSDDKDIKIYKYDASGNLVGSFDLATVHPYHNAKPSGVASVGDYVYVLDQASKQVYQYTCSGTLVDVSKKLLKAAGSSVGNIDGLAINGTDMWVLSGNDKNIYQYPLGTVFPDGGTLTATVEIALDNDNKGAVGLAIDSTYLYVVDYATSSKETRFYQYRRSDGALTAVSKVLLEKTPNNNKLQSPAGAMFDGTSLWVVDSGTNKVYEYDKDAPFLGSGSINAISEFALDGNNTDATGV